MAQAGWSDGNYFAFSITDAAFGFFLGACSLSHIHSIYRFCNLSYWIRTSYRGHGFAGCASRLAARFAIERLKLVRVEIVTAASNAASQGADKIGTHHEGILLNRIIVRSEVHDAVMYSLIPADFGLTPQL